MNEIALSYVTITYHKPIVYMVFKEDVELGFPEIKELTAYAEQVSNYTPYLTLSDVRANVNVTNEGKRYLEDLKNLPYFRGSAVLVKNNVYKFTINFLSSFNKRKYPTRAFTSQYAAIKWLQTLPVE